VAAFRIIGGCAGASSSWIGLPARFGQGGPALSRLWGRVLSPAQHQGGGPGRCRPPTPLATRPAWRGVGVVLAGSPRATLSAPGGGLAQLHPRPAAAGDPVDARSGSAGSRERPCQP